SFPVSASHTRTVWSHEEVTTRFPSGLNDADTPKGCPRRSASTRPVSASCTRAVPSSDPMPTPFPPRLTDAESTKPLGPPTLAPDEPPHPPRRGVPPPPGGVVARPGDHPLPVRAERRRIDQAGVPLEPGEFLAGLGVPHPGGVVARSRDHLPPVRAEQRSQDR